jgi:hypothetical protein
MPPSATYNALVEACIEPGCPICRVEHDAALRYISGLFYEQTNDFNLRERLRASLGFCRQHAHLMVEELQGNALGIALIYQDVLKVAINHLEDRHGTLAPVRKCPACEQRDLSMMRTISELSKNIQDETITKALKASEGLCFFHLRHTLRHMRMPEKRELLISIQREIMSRLRLDLGEFIRKNDYRFSKESFGPERDSWKRAVSMVSGAKIGKSEK